MSRYIDADIIRDEWLHGGENEHIYDTNNFLDSIDYQPTADVEPVRHAHWTDATPTGWITPGGDPIVVCSHCGGAKHMGGIESGAPWKYCKDCGAKMEPLSDDQIKVGKKADEDYRKQVVCSSLNSLIAQTNELPELHDLEYINDLETGEECVKARFYNGAVKKINVHMDGKMALILDVVEELIK